MHNERHTKKTKNKQFMWCLCHDGEHNKKLFNVILFVRYVLKVLGT